MFEKTVFIKSGKSLDPADHTNCIAPMFRCRFEVGVNFGKAELSVCGLGYGYYYLNGKNITDELFTAAESDYTKTLWYNTYDVTPLLKRGSNILAVICGNGYYNEIFKTPWNYHEAPWRDNPKFILSLDVDGKTVLGTGKGWACSLESPIVYNQLRSGEHFDARLYDENWTSYDYDDSGWDEAVIDDNPPTGTFKPCECEPIRECGEYTTRNIIETEDGCIFDIGQNISGYARLRVNQSAGDEITIHYAEELNPDHTLKRNDMPKFYPESEFACDRFICPDGEFTWSPHFAYHGFRYVKVTGLKNPSPESVTGIFVHQDVRTLTEFECSDERLNRLFAIGQMAVLSNLFWKPTDCPTREKLGWANDAQASTEHLLLNFGISKLFRKWMVDIADAMREDGALPGIIPTSGWGYHWGNGPVSEGILFEIPYRIYLTEGDDSLLKSYYPYFKRSLDWYRSQANKEGFIEYGLNDWAAPTPTQVPLSFINAALFIKFLKITKLAAECAGLAADVAALTAEIDERRNHFTKHFMNPDGTCAVNEQTSVAMVIYHGLYDRLDPLKVQLAALVEAADFHHNCGMVGLRHLYDALNTCGLPEYAYKVITADGFPGYLVWLDGGATTLWELWNCKASKNHHMYSDFMGWLVKNLVGINLDRGEYTVNPRFLPQLDRCRGSRLAGSGRLEVEWVRAGDGSITLEIGVPEEAIVKYGDSTLSAGKHRISVEM